MQTQKTSAIRNGAIGNQVWRFDPAYTTVEFSVRNLWYTVRGRFRTLEGSIVLDETDISRSSVLAKIDPRSIDTGNKRRDAHLQSADFLDGQVNGACITQRASWCRCVVATVAVGGSPGVSVFG